MENINLNVPSVKKLFIDYENYDIYNLAPEGEEFIDWFRCDKGIAETVSILNKKGYITDSNSCEGHMPKITSAYIEGFGQTMGAFIAFKPDITIPSFPEGFYQEPMAVGDGFPNCLVSAITEGLPVIDEKVTKLPLEDNEENAALIAKLRSRLPLIDNHGYTYQPNEEEIGNLVNYFETNLVRDRENLNIWAKSLPKREVLGKSK